RESKDPVRSGGSWRQVQVSGTDTWACCLGKIFACSRCSQDRYLLHKALHMLFLFSLAVQEVCSRSTWAAELALSPLRIVRASISCRNKAKQRQQPNRQPIASGLRAQQPIASGLRTPTAFCRCFVSIQGGRCLEHTLRHR
ncbi:unnamed protein product, partial [Ectocarpus sp. 4 AP-2014]